MSGASVLMWASTGRTGRPKAAIANGKIRAKLLTLTPGTVGRRLILPAPIAFRLAHPPLEIAGTMLPSPRARRAPCSRPSPRSQRKETSTRARGGHSPLRLHHAETWCRQVGRRAGVELHRSRVASPQSRTAEQQHRSYDASWTAVSAALARSCWAAPGSRLSAVNTRVTPFARRPAATGDGSPTTVICGTVPVS